MNTTLREFAQRNEGCQACEHILFCGGCRASALIEQEDYFAPDPATCIFFKEEFEAKLAKVVKANGGTLH